MLCFVCFCVFTFFFSPRRASTSTQSPLITFFFLSFFLITDHLDLPQSPACYKISQTYTHAHAPIKWRKTSNKIIRKKKKKWWKLSCPDIERHAFGCRTFCVCCPMKYKKKKRQQAETCGVKSVRKKTSCCLFKVFWGRSSSSQKKKRKSLLSSFLGGVCHTKKTSKNCWKKSSRHNLFSSQSHCLPKPRATSGKKKKKAQERQYQITCLSHPMTRCARLRQPFSRTCVSKFPLRIARVPRRPCFRKWFARTTYANAIT